MLRGRQREQSLLQRIFLIKRPTFVTSMGYSSMVKYCYLFFLLAGCLNNQKISSFTASGSKKLQFLPVQISYTGVKLEDSLKYFIAQYLKEKNVNVIDIETGRAMITEELKRAAGLSKPADPEEFQKQLGRNQQYVFNLLTLDFKLDTTGQQIIMGWKVDPEPVNFSRLIIAKWKYLNDHKISDSPPQVELKTLCDSIIYSKSLY